LRIEGLGQGYAEPASGVVEEDLLNFYLVMGDGRQAGESGLS